MAAIDCTGTAVPVALLADPFARQLVIAAQTGNFGFQDGGITPLDLFDPPATIQSGVAVVILNCLSTPLKLVDTVCYIGGFDDNPVNQVSYPAQANDLDSAHRIPGTRAYPRPSLHQRPPGGPALMGGVGLYRFGPSHPRTVTPDVRVGLSFSAQADGSGPRVGVAFRTIFRPGNGQNTLDSVTTHSAVSGDVAGQYSNLSKFFALAMGTDDGATAHWDPPYPAGNQYHVGPGPNGIAIWATFAKLKPAAEPDMHTLTVWVRDAASTLGM